MNLLLKPSNNLIFKRLIIAFQELTENIQLICECRCIEIEAINLSCMKVELCTSFFEKFEFEFSHNLLIFNIDAKLFCDILNSVGIHDKLELVYKNEIDNLLELIIFSPGSIIRSYRLNKNSNYVVPLENERIQFEKTIYKCKFQISKDQLLKTFNHMTLISDKVELSVDMYGIDFRSTDSHISACVSITITDRNRLELIQSSSASYFCRRIKKYMPATFENVTLTILGNSLLIIQSNNGEAFIEWYEPSIN
jgi:hypothetical protein